MTSLTVLTVNKFGPLSHPHWTKTTNLTAGTAARSLLNKGFVKERDRRGQRMLRVLTNGYTRDLGDEQRRNDGRFVVVGDKMQGPRARAKIIRCSLDTLIDCGE